MSSHWQDQALVFDLPPLPWTYWVSLLFVLRTIKKKQARGAIWGLLPDAVTDSGNDLCGQYSTNNQTKPNNTLCTNTLKTKEGKTENRTLPSGTATQKGKQETATTWEEQNPTGHPASGTPWSCCLDSQIVREKFLKKIKNLHQLLVQNRHF